MPTGKHIISVECTTLKVELKSIYKKGGGELSLKKIGYDAYANSNNICPRIRHEVYAADAQNVFIRQAVTEF